MDVFHKLKSALHSVSTLFDIQLAFFNILMTELMTLFFFCQMYLSFAFVAN